MIMLADILACLGVDDFNKLVRSYDDTKQRGRFRFWQTPLLERAATASGLPLTRVESFIEVFADARHVKRTIQKAEFLADPTKFWYDGDANIDPEWILDAWNSSPSFVDAVSYDIARSVSKTGEFNLAKLSIEAIRHKLSPNQYVQLYIYVRDESERLEFEWRPEFCRLFPESADFIPPKEEA